MNKKTRLSLIIWITSIILCGDFIGSLTKPEALWYGSLKRSSLTPPSYVFPFAWNILYFIIGVCGSIIWQVPSFSKLRIIKILFVIQLILNLSWTPLFFYYHLSGVSLLVLYIMDIFVLSIIVLTYKKIRFVSLLITPYFLWILFASYLNFYIWQHN